VSSGLLVDVADEVFLGTTTLVCNWLIRASREELDSWVARDSVLLSQGLGVLGLAVNLGNNDVLVTGEINGKVFPGWGKLLAVYTIVNKLIKRNRKKKREKTYVHTMEQ
jgi:hypothetical protein